MPHSCLLCERGIKAPTSENSSLAGKLPLCRLCKLELTSIPQLGSVSLNGYQRGIKVPVQACHDQQQTIGLPNRPMDCTALWPFSPFARTLLHRAKFGPSKTLLRFMGEMLGTLCTSTNTKDENCTPQDITLIIPVPASEQHSRTRLIDSTHIIATSLGLPAPVRQLFSRTRVSKPQSSLNGRERIQNARVSFNLQRTSIEQVPGQRILLVDDVATTGASLYTLAEHLYKRGAEKVSAALVCLNESNFG